MTLSSQAEAPRDRGKMQRDDEPIAALATGYGASAVAVIRLSGPACHELLDAFLVPKNRIAPPDRTLFLANLYDPRSGQVIDEPLAVFFAGPRSFTGQDCAEIHCHGGPYIVQRILTILFTHGFRQALPGEFTRRAFLNGKMDLTAAEGVRELVEAQSEQQWLAARQLATGKLRSVIDDLRKKLIEAMAYLEARIDFPDEGETASVSLDHVNSRVRRVEEAIAQLASTYDSGRVASQGLMVALFGPPNAGKSTLLNTLLGRDRAIVSAIPGTTRDYLEERCLVGGRLIRLVDMAGVREGGEAIEMIGVERSRTLAREADVVIHLCAADESKDDFIALHHWLKTHRGERPTFSLLTKSDLGAPAWAAEFPAISCKTGTGLDDLTRRLASYVDGFVGQLEEQAFITSARHKAAIDQTQNSLDAFRSALDQRQFDECLAFELLQAARALTSIIGEVSNDDVLDKIFSEFCVGK